jgi:hypothetical protein
MPTDATDTTETAAAPGVVTAQLAPAQSAPGVATAQPASSVAPAQLAPGVAPAKSAPSLASAQPATAQSAPDRPASRGGRFSIGLGQALLIWVAVVAAVPLVRQAVVMTVIAGAGLLSVILIGQLHRRQARHDSAVGAFTGAVLWPVLIGLTIALINVASMALSDFE